MESKRWLALDCFKAVAIFVMILWHLSVWWINLSPSIEKGLLMVGVTPWPYLLQVIVAFSGHFSMSIPAVAGASLRFYLDKIEKTAANKGKILYVTAKRAVALAALGYALNLLAFGPSAWRSWNVLQLISLSMILITFLVLYSSPYFLAMSGLAAIFAAPFLRYILQNNDSYYALMLVGDRLGDNIWSVFPWYGVIAYGFLAVHLYLYSKRKHNEKKFRLLIFTASLLLIGTALFKNRFFYAVDLNYPWGALLFQPPTLSILAQLSVFSIFLFLMDFIFAKTKELGRFSIVNVFSRGILWIYLVHMIVGFRLIEFLANNGFSSIIVFFFVVLSIFALSYAVGALSVLIKTL